MNKLILNKPNADQTDPAPFAGTRRAAKQNFNAAQEETPTTRTRKEKHDTVLHFVPAKAGIYALQIDGVMLGQIAAQPEGLYLSVPFKHGGTSRLTVSLISEATADDSVPVGCSGELCTRVTAPGNHKVAEMHFKLSRFMPSQIWEFTNE
jgi:hypothetical protein